MKPVLIDDRPRRRQFGDLVAERFGVIAVKDIATPAATGRPARDDLPEWLGRDQGPGVMAMTGLPAPFLPRGGRRRSSRERGGIGGRGLGGGGGVLVELLFQLGDPPLEGLDHRRDRCLGFG